MGLIFLRALVILGLFVNQWSLRNPRSGKVGANPALFSGVPAPGTGQTSDEGSNKDVRSDERINQIIYDVSLLFRYDRI